MLKHERDAEKKAFKEMRFKDKVGHIWEYYRQHIIGTIAGIFLIASLINVWFINPSKNPSVHVMIVAEYAYTEDMSDLQKQLNEQFPQYQTEDEEILVGFTTTNRETGNLYEIERQKFIAMMAANDLNIVIGNIEDIKGYAVNDIFVNLEEFFTEDDLEGHSYEFVETSVVEYGYSGEVINEEEPQPYILDISEIETLNKIISGDDVGLSILLNADNIEATKEIARYLINLK